MPKSWLKRAVSKPVAEDGAEPARSIIAIRCIGYSARVHELREQLVRALPSSPVVFVVDDRSGTSEWPDGYDVVRMTDDTLDSLGLFHARGNVGWACGDYSYYMLLEREWDFLWLIEPDVGFIGGSESELAEFDESDADLIGTRIGGRGPNWPWRQRLERVDPTLDVKAVFFPLTRVSRRLAERLLEVRREHSITLDRKQSLHVPNDESVTATVALGEGFTWVDLKSDRPDLFEHWNWSIRFPFEDMVAAGLGRFIVHPALTAEEFSAYVDDEQARILTTGARISDRLGPSLQWASPETRERAVTRFVRAARLALS